MPEDIGSGLILTASSPDAPGWRNRLCDHLLKLGPESRLNRFLVCTPDAVVRRYAETAQPAVIVAAMRGEELCGLAELHLRGEDTLAEIALSVDEDFRRNGLGQALFDRVLGEARIRGVREVWIVYLRTNEAMRRIAERSGFVRLPDRDPSVVQARAVIAAPALPRAGRAPGWWRLGRALKLVRSALDVAARGA